MVSEILQEIISIEPFNEATVATAIKEFPELMSEQNFVDMNDFLSHKSGAEYERTLDVYDCITTMRLRPSKQQQQLQLLKDKSLVFCRNGDTLLETDPYAALVNYINALKIEVALKNLSRVEELLLKFWMLRPTMLEDMVKMLFDVYCDLALGLEAMDHPRISELRIKLLKDIMEGFLHYECATADLLILWFQQTKGFKYMSTLGQMVEWSSPNGYGMSLQKQIYEENKINAVAENHLANYLDEEMLLGGYLGEKEKDLNEDSVAKLANLKVDFDRWLNKYLLKGIEEGDYPILTAEAVQATLNEREILYLQFVGGAVKAKAAAYILLVTKQDIILKIACSRSDIEAEVALMKEGVAYTTPALTFGVSNLRKAIQNDPDEGLPTSQETINLLEERVEFILGAVSQDLDVLLAKGKTELVFQPHGVFHYYPFQLLPYKEGLLSDYFTITVVPNLRLLQTYTQDTTNQLLEVATFGLCYEGSKNNPPLSNSIREAEEIAKIFGETAFTDSNETATVENFEKAFQMSKRIHLSAHGLLNTAAPAFQRLFLSSNNKKDQGLEAWELMNLDGRNVNLLTLSACQTALGRFDLMDNLYGLPAMFLKAGVSTIIGTLWEVETYSAETFFVTLYQAIKEGKSKKQALMEAQGRTRTEHQEYRDWGAFFYLGR